MLGRIGITAAALSCASCSLLDLDSLGSATGSTSSAPATAGSGAGGTAGTGGDGASGGAGGAGAGASSSSAGGAGGGASSSSMASSGSGGAGGAGFDPPWWDVAWPKRARIDVANIGGTTLPNGFEVGFPVDVGAVFGNGVSPSSLRAVHWSDSSDVWDPIPTYVEIVAGAVWVWLPLQEAAPPQDVINHYWLYADNPNPPPPDPPSTVFTVWQPFDSLAGWLATGGPVFSNGTLKLTASDAVRSPMPFDPGMAVDFTMTVVTPVSCGGCWICGGFQRTNDFNNEQPWVLWIDRDQAGLVQPEVEIYAANAQSAGGTKPIPPGIEHLYGVERYLNQVIFRYDGAVSDTIAHDDYNEQLSVRLGVVGGASEAEYGFARVRRAADPPPQVTLVNPETL